MAIPQDIAAMAGAIGAGMDNAIAGGAEIMTPTGKYSARALNALVSELNEILPMMGRTDMYPEFTEDQTQLPMDMVQLLMAVQSIAEMAQVEFEMDLATLTDDNAVAKLAALIKRLRTDKRMQDYLAMEEAPTPMEPVETPMAGSAPQPSEMSDEELFTSRMG